MVEQMIDEADRSHEETRDLLRAAVAPAGADPYRIWVRGVYDDWFAYTDETVDKTYKRSYVIDDKDVVTLGNPEEVVATMSYEPVGEAQEAREVELTGDIMALVEQAVAADNICTLRFITPGWGTSGYYSPEVLERDGAKVFPAGTQMFWDHATSAEEKAKPEGSLDRLVGKFVTDAAWRPEGADGAGLYADAQVYKNWAGLVNELAPDIGVSIRALGRVKEGEAEGRDGPIITELTTAKSVDYVTTAGAGGKVLQLFESARKSQEVDIAMEKELKELQEANDALVAEKEALTTDNEWLEGALRGSRMWAFLTTTLAKADIAEPTREKLSFELAESWTRNPDIFYKDRVVDKEAAKALLDEAVTAELAYLASVSEKQEPIRGMGEHAATDATEKLFEAEKSAWIKQGKTEAEAENLAKLAARGR